MMAGRIVIWRADRGFGFIRPAAWHSDLFVHIHALPIGAPAPRVGARVLFSIGKGPDGRMRADAVEVSAAAGAGGFSADAPRAPACPGGAARDIRPEGVR